MKQRLISSINPVRKKVVFYFIRAFNIEGKVEWESGHRHFKREGAEKEILEWSKFPITLPHSFEVLKQVIFVDRNLELE